MKLPRPTTKCLLCRSAYSTHVPAPHWSLPACPDGSGRMFRRLGVVGAPRRARRRVRSARSVALAKVIGAELRAMRHRTGMTLEEVGVRCDADRTHIWQVETGRKLPTIETVLDIAAACGGSFVRIARLLEHEHAEIARAQAAAGAAA